jgi:APA family basic amino acid/polyamine antiporter
MQQKKLGPLLLSALMIGPILGSGIIILPPIAQELFGRFAILAWGVMMCLGGLFAMVFATLALKFPGAEGASIAVRRAFGPRIGVLASTYVSLAVCAGPVVILITAGETVMGAFSLPPSYLPGVVALLLFVSVTLLLRKVTAVGNIVLVASSAIALALVGGSVMTIASYGISFAGSNDLDPVLFVRELPILFWAITGWEILGNYSSEVKDPKTTIPIAAIFSVAGISLVYILVALALNALTLSGAMVHPESGVAGVLSPLLGNGSELALMVMTLALCLCTYLMIVGGVARLIQTLARDGRLHGALALGNHQGAPLGAILFFAASHSLVILLLVFHMASIISFANLFFLANALLGILAAVKLSTSFVFRLLAILPGAGCVALILLSSPWLLCLLAGVTLVFFAVNARGLGVQARPSNP